MLRRLAKRVVRKLVGDEGAQSSVGSDSSPVHADPKVEAEAETLANIEAGCQEIYERIGAGEPVLVLDVREVSETAEGIIEGAILIPLSEMEKRWEEVKDANEIVCVCARGQRSLRAATFLREKGVFNATSLEGGVAAWLELGGTLVKPG